MIRPTHDGWIGTWSPSIGDPNLSAWVLVALYFAAATLSWRSARQLRPTARLERWWWLGLSALLIALGINKQLDLQTALTELGRVVTRELGIVGLRALMRWGAVIGLGLGALVAGWVLVRLARRAPRPTQLAVWATAALLGFIVLRAASFYRVGLGRGGVNISWPIVWLLEFVPLLTICIGAMGRTRTSMGAHGRERAKLDQRA